MTEPKGPNGRGGRFFADVLSFGWVLPASIAAGAGLGWVGDRLLGIFPVLTAVFALLGLAAGLRALLKEADELSEDLSKAPPPDPRDTGGDEKRP